MNTSLNETNEGSDLPFGSLTAESENSKPRITDGMYLKCFVILIIIIVLLFSITLSSELYLILL